MISLSFLTSKVFPIGSDRIGSDGIGSGNENTGGWRPEIRERSKLSPSRANVSPLVRRRCPAVLLYSCSSQMGGPKAPARLTQPNKRERQQLACDGLGSEPCWRGRRLIRQTHVNKQARCICIKTIKTFTKTVGIVHFVGRCKSWWLLRQVNIAGRNWRTQRAACKQRERERERDYHLDS